jgi:hypothetical protein
MVTPPFDGWLFFWGEAHTCVGYDVSRSCARLHSTGLRLLPIDFYVTFDDFLTVGKCRLAWRWRDDVGVIFEGWVDDPFDQLHWPLTGASSDFRDVIAKLKAWRS